MPVLILALVLGLVVAGGRWSASRLVLACGHVLGLALALVLAVAGGRASCWCSFSRSFSFSFSFSCWASSSSWLAAGGRWSASQPMFAHGLVVCVDARPRPGAWPGARARWWPAFALVLVRVSGQALLVVDLAVLAFVSVAVALLVALAVAMLLALVRGRWLALLLVTVAVVSVLVI